MMSSPITTPKKIRPSPSPRDTPIKDRLRNFNIETKDILNEIKDLNNSDIQTPQQQKRFRVRYFRNEFKFKIVEN